MSRVLLTGSLLLCAVLCACTSVFLYPDRKLHLADRPLGTPAETVWIKARDGSRLHALYLPTSGVPRATLLHLHGNAENLSSHVHLVTWLPQHGYAVLSIDYRGYGLSQGQTSVAALHEDAETALAWLVDRGAERTGPLVVLGQSIGGAVAIRMVARTPLRGHVAGVIADSAFSSYRRIAREKLAAFWLTWPLQWPLSRLIGERYAPIDVVAELSPIPLLLIHGGRDQVVDPSHAQRLFAAACDPKTLWLIPEAGHIDVLRRAGERERLLAFLDVWVSAAKTDLRCGPACAAASRRPVRMSGAGIGVAEGVSPESLPPQQSQSGAPVPGVVPTACRAAVSPAGGRGVGIQGSRIRKALTPRRPADKMRALSRRPSCGGRVFSLSSREVQTCQQSIS